MNNLLEKDHIHSWIKWKVTDKGAYFKCSHPFCYSTMEKRLLLGKTSLCPSCLVNTFELTLERLRRSKPVCPQTCSMTKEDITKRSLQGNVMGALDKLFKIPEDPNDKIKE